MPHEGCAQIAACLVSSPGVQAVSRLDLVECALVSSGCWQSQLPGKCQRVFWRQAQRPRQQQLRRTPVVHGFGHRRERLSRRTSGEKDLRLFCGWGHVPESLVGSASDCRSGDTPALAVGKPLVRLLMDGRPCDGACCWAIVAILLWE